MRAWNELSMAEKADVMKLAIEGGVYDLDAIRNGYNKFAGGGAVTNEIAEDYQPLVSDSYQSIMNSMKASNAGFNVDDYAYRVKKMHPEITREQVQSLYNATPYIASDKVKGVTEGGFRAGDSTGYGRRVTLYPEAHYKNTGTKITPANANAEMGDTMTHETNHLYTDVLLGGTNEAEGDLLWDAYRPGLVVQDPNFNGEYSEERAINAGIRNRISRENGNVIGEELDKAIDNTPDDVLMNMLFDPNNGYINQSGKKHMQDKNGNWNRTDAVRRALKDVAFNQTELPDNYAAFGGSLVQAANEYANGGKIHIKPENRGKFTALKKRTGHSATWFKQHGTPAQRKMATFALNARKWKHEDGGNLFLIGGPTQDDYPEGYWENRREHAEVKPRYIRTKKDDEYWEEKNRRNAEAAEELNRRKGVVMSALSNTANSVPFTGSEVAEAAEAQRQEKLDKAHELKLGLDATMTAAEFLAAGYGVARGLTHLNRYMARQATQSTGQAISREAMQNLAKWNRRVAQVDKPQVLMNGIGGTADAYQWYTADNSFDAWENGLETGANAAGVVGGMNWFRNLPYLRRIGGDKIDAVLDGLGYGAASWDIVKNIPPLSTVLESAREESR